MPRKASRQGGWSAWRNPRHLRGYDDSGADEDEYARLPASERPGDGVSPGGMGHVRNHLRATGRTGRLSSTRTGTERSGRTAERRLREQAAIQRRVTEGGTAATTRRPSSRSTV